MYDLLKLNEYQLKKDLLKDKNILVTGAGDGIGRAVAQAYAQHGATVILLGKTEHKLETVYDIIEKQGGAQPAIVPFDLASTDENMYIELAQQIIESLGSLHGLLHNAGQLGELKPLSQYSADMFSNIVNINLTSNFLLTKSLLPALSNADNASVVFTSSGVGRKARAYWGAYAVSKFGVEALMQIWADELESSSSIRVNSLNPQATDTTMRRKAYPGEAQGSNPTPSDIVPAYLFLMGDDSIEINGQQLNARPQSC